jgi:uncharacterized SAM-binding protein YcdF (DUF218 family)
MTASHARFYRYLIAGAGLIAALWIGGLFLFVSTVEDLNEPITQNLDPTDAIVVLTGGSERLTNGLELLNAHKAKKLFISGVYPGLTLDHLLINQPVSKELRDCCIILGHAAESTQGNADETLTWMNIEKYDSMRLVTANYHMPRSLLIFRSVMPDMDIVPYPVTPSSVKFHSWWRRPGTASLLVTEYNKYLIAILRLHLATLL